MKDQISNIAIEGTCSGDVVGGLSTVDRGKPSDAFVFKRGIFQGIDSHAEDELSGLFWELKPPFLL